MKIQILNKNRININGNWELSNIRAYDVDEGSVILQTYNETLDSGTVFISNVSNKIEIEPYDLVLLTDEENRIADTYMCVDTYSETQTSIVPLIYSYEINLFSETKLLENYICPDLSITIERPTAKSIHYYMSIYNKMFGKKVYCNSGRWEQHTAWTFSQRLYDRFTQIDAPEKQWNKPTLREVFNDLLLVDDCIVVLRNGVIDYIDLTESNLMSEQKKSHINYIRESRSSEDYVSEIQMSLQNVLSDNVIVTTENIVLTPESDNILNEKNGVLKTKYSILNVRDFVMGFFDPVRGSYSNEVEYKLQGIPSLIKEDSEWATKPIVSKMSINNTSFPNLLLYQNTLLHYKRGTNVIKGFGDTLRIGESNKELTLLQRLIRSWSASGGIDIPTSTLTELQDKQWERYVYFRITYETNAGDTFSASKSDFPTHDKIIIDHQTNSWVNSDSQGSLEYYKANRLGNKQLLLNAIYEDDYTNLIKIGDNYFNGENNLIYQVEYSIYKHYIQVNAYATKDYILQNYFTGIKSRIRTWKNAEDEAFERNDLVKMYLELSYTEHRIMYQFSKEDRVTFWDGDLLYQYIKPFSKGKYKYVFFRTIDNDNNYKPNINSFFAGELISRIRENSIVFTLGMNENWYMGNGFDPSAVKILPYDYFDYYISITDDFTDLGGVPIRHYQYVDDNGKFKSIIMHFTVDKETFEPDEYDVISGEDFLDHFIDGQLTSDRLWRKIIKKPIVPVNQISQDITVGVTLNKDNREIPIISTQFEVCSDTRDITFTQDFVRSFNLINDTDNYNVSTLKVYQGAKSDYNYANPSIRNATLIPGASVSISSVNTIQFNGIGTERNRALYITDANDNVLIGCIPKPDGDDFDIAINYLISRDKNYYDINNKNIKIGEVL